MLTHTSIIHRFIFILASFLLVDFCSSQSEVTKMPVCDEDHLMVYLAEIQAINPESIINLSTIEDLDILCKHVSVSLDKMDEFLRGCQVPEQRDLYIQLIKGVDKLYDSLCTNDSTIRIKFEHYFPCLRDLHQDFEDCYGVPDWAEEQESETVCQIYKDIVDCYYIKAAKVCGLKAAAVMKDLIKHVVDGIVEIKCNLDPNPIVIDPMPDSKAGSNSIDTKLLVIITITYLINTFH